MSDPWYCYNSPNEEPCQSLDEIKFYLNTPPVCMIQCIDIELLICLAGETLYNYSIGHFLCSSGSCQTGIKLSPPFDSVESAFEYASEHFHVNKFFQFP